MELWDRIEPLLERVQKPARYIGLEDGHQRPIHTPDGVSWLLMYPDSYEVGLPNQGLQILYEILNEREDSTAERSYCPWIDMEWEMRAWGVPLFSVDTHRPAGEFDVIGFNLAAELTYTNLLNAVDLAGVPVRQSERTDHHPFVVAGGHCTYNPEPLADYLDFVVLGDGEETVGELSEVLAAWKRGGKAGGRMAVLRQIADVAGVYVPSYYKPVYAEPCHEGQPGVLTELRALDGVPEVVEKRTVASLADWPYPKSQLVPLTDVVHDRLNVEIFRGCTRGCRFCQAGMVTRPVRERPDAQIRRLVAEGIRRTGYDEVTLTSLSSADYSGINDTLAGIQSECGVGEGGGGGISISLPSLRVDAFGVEVAAGVASVRKSGLTFAPEGGTWRMRKVINKAISDEDLFAAVEAAFSKGWRRIKLYFLIGLPTETDQDVLGIAELGKACVGIGRRYHHSASVTVSVGGFVPKAQTPFQWFGQNTPAELQRKVELLQVATRRVKGVNLKWHDPEASTAEGIASRGDRRVGRAIERVWRQGGTFQEWSENFDLDRWSKALEAEGLSLDFVVFRDRSEDELLPWAHISSGLYPDFLWEEWQDALAETTTPDCRWTSCYNCGACTEDGIEHVVGEEAPVWLLAARSVPS